MIAVVLAAGRGTRLGDIGVPKPLVLVGGVAVIDRIQSEFEYKPKRSGLCDWCEYNDRCPIYPTRAKASSEPIAPPPPLPMGQLQLL